MFTPFKKWKQLRFIWVNHSSYLVCLLLVHQSFASTFRSFPLVDSLGEKQKDAGCFFVYIFLCLVSLVSYWFPQFGTYHLCPTISHHQLGQVAQEAKRDLEQLGQDPEALDAE